MSVRQKRKLLIVGNWKMHLNTSQASLLVHRLHERIRIHRNIEVVLAPSYLHLQPLSLQIDRRKFRLAAQNGYFKDEGAYTGEVSLTMLSGLVHYAIIGHSERRHIFNESLDDIRDKVAAAFRNDITPILCVGETKEEREAGETNQVIHDQVISGISNLTAPEVSKMVIAYEPVWAIGTGTAATSTQAQDAAAHIRYHVSELYGPKAASRLRILYGASVSGNVSRAFLDENDIDGLLVGSASLNYHEFTSIINAAYRSIHTIDTMDVGK